VAFLPIGVYEQRTDKDKSSQAGMAQAGIEDIACGDNRVHESIRKRFRSHGRGHMEDNRYVPASNLTILARKEVSFENLKLRPWLSCPRRRLDAGDFAGRPSKTHDIAKTTI